MFQQIKKLYIKKSHWKKGENSNSAAVTLNEEEETLVEGVEEKWHQWHYCNNYNDYKTTTTTTKTIDIEENKITTTRRKIKEFKSNRGKKTIVYQSCSCNQDIDGERPQIIEICRFGQKMANTLSVMTNVLRNVVSKQRIRYKEKGFNLDLAYICDNIIAMGYPADNIERIYRNRLEDVYKFLEENHHDRYKIYNLCLERSYDVNKFHGRVAAYPFEDHNPPTIELIQRFCADVDEWLKADTNNVAAVHCKAGKGRTGTMICCYLIYSNQQQTAEDALAYYDEKRTKDRKGVTIPSQRRYVQYFARLLRSNLRYERRFLEFFEIRFTEANAFYNQGTVHCSISALEDSCGCLKVQPLQNLNIDFRKSFTLDMKNFALRVSGDIKIELTQKPSKRKLLHFWFNTYFVYESAILEGEGENAKLVYTLNKWEIDDAHKDKEHKMFSDDFKVQLAFYNESPESMNFNRSNDNHHLHRTNLNVLPVTTTTTTTTAATTTTILTKPCESSNSSNSEMHIICDEQAATELVENEEEEEEEEEEETYENLIDTNIIKPYGNHNHHHHHNATTLRPTSLITLNETNNCKLQQQQHRRSDMLTTTTNSNQQNKLLQMQQQIKINNSNHQHNNHIQLATTTTTMRSINNQSNISNSSNSSINSHITSVSSSASMASTSGGIISGGKQQQQQQKQQQQQQQLINDFNEKHEDDLDNDIDDNDHDDDDDDDADREDNEEDWESGESAVNKPLPTTTTTITTNSTTISPTIRYNEKKQLVTNIRNSTTTNNITLTTTTTTTTTNKAISKQQQLKKISSNSSINSSNYFNEFGDIVHFYNDNHNNYDVDDDDDDDDNNTAANNNLQQNDDNDDDDDEEEEANAIAAKCSTIPTISCTNNNNNNTNNKQLMSNLAARYKFMHLLSAKASNKVMAPRHSYFKRKSIKTTTTATTKNDNIDCYMLTTDVVDGIDCLNGEKLRTRTTSFGNSSGCAGGVGGGLAKASKLKLKFGLNKTNSKLKWTQKFHWLQNYVRSSDATVDIRKSTTTTNQRLNNSTQPQIVVGGGGEGIDCDYYSSICDNQLSFNNSPLKTTKTTTPNMMNDDTLKVVVVAARPANIADIGFNVKSTNNTTTTTNTTTNSIINISTMVEATAAVAIGTCSLANSNASGSGSNSSSGYATASTLHSDSSIYTTPTPTINNFCNHVKQHENISPFIFPNICAEITELPTNTTTTTTTNTTLIKNGSIQQYDDNNEQA